MGKVRILEIKESVFADNDRQADQLRSRLKEKGVFLMNLMSSPGSGKTTTLKRTIAALKIPHHDYEIKIFDSPEVLDLEIQKKANSEKSRLSRVIANYDWDYKKGKKPEDTSKKYWEVDVWIEDQRWHKPWNYELEQNLNKDEKKKIKEQAWAEQAHTINEVGSTYTIQGFDLNYAGVILGKSVKYRDGKIIYDPSESSNGKATKNRTMEDGTKQNFAKELLKHEVRVLMTRGVNGLYIYACDDQLREALKKAAEQE